MRLFVAIDIPEDVRAAIGGFVAKLRPVCRAARWTRIENAHITLKFIGEVSLETFEGIKTALSQIRLAGPIHMSLRGVGFFPDERRPRVFWAGIEAGGELGVLAEKIQTALEPLGVPREPRAFSPHLTLARLESGRELDGLKSALTEATPLEFGGTIAKEFHLYQSILKSSGAEYTRLASYPFAEGESR